MRGALHTLADKAQVQNKLLEEELTEAIQNAQLCEADLARVQIKRSEVKIFSEGHPENVDSDREDQLYVINKRGQLFWKAASVYDRRRN